MSKYLFGILFSLLLASLMISPQTVHATLNLGDGSYFIGGSNKSTGFSNCEIRHYRNGINYLTRTVGGAPLSVISFGSLSNLADNRYNIRISGCTGGTLSMMGVYRSPGNTAYAGYGGNFDSYNHAYISGVVNRHYNNNSAIFITTDTADRVNMRLYDHDGVLRYDNYFLFTSVEQTLEFDFTDHLLPAGRYLVHLESQDPAETFHAMVVNFDGGLSEDRRFAYRGAAAETTTIYAPTFRKNYYGYNSTIVVSNTEAVAGNVTIKLYPGAYELHNYTVNPKATVALGTGNFPYVPDGDYAVVVTSTRKIVGVVNSSHDTTDRHGAYSMMTIPGKYQSFPVLWNYTPYDNPRITTVKCMNVGSTTGKIRLTIQGGAYADSPTLSQYGSYEFALLNIPQFPYRGMFAGLAESLSGGNISCVASSNIAGGNEDKFFQYESHVSNNDTNQFYSSESLTFYDDDN